MMRRSVVLPLVLSLASTFGFGTANAQSSTVIVRPLDAQSVQAGQLFSRDQIDNLVGPVALYPDPLLAQVLVASTFPDQIESAARFVRSNGTRDVDDQAWDVSVKAVAHYPSTLNMMADKLDWTASLGQAYAGQSSDVMESVQRLRAMASAQGNLVSTPQQQVVVNEGYYEIVPAQPRVIYVPVYDPFVIYTRPVFYAGGFGGYWSFGIGFPIGAWLSYDCDWRGGRVYYDGWSGRGWRSRSRPYVSITNVYVNRRFENVYVNHAVRQRPVNYREVDRYRSVHPDAPFGGRERDRANPGRGGERNGNVGRGNDSRDNPVRGNPGRDNAGRDNNPGRDNAGRDNNPGRDNAGRENPGRGNAGRDNPGRGNPGNSNRIIDRGPDVRDPRMNASRSREPERSTPTVRMIPGPPASAPHQPEARSPQPAPRAAPQAERRRPEGREAGRGRQEGDKKERDRKP